MGDGSYTPSRRPELFANPEDDPYEAMDVAELPAWWRENVETFNAHGLRPYRPPRFADGERTMDVIEPLEAELGVDVRLRCRNPHETDDWEVWIDDRRVARVGHHRDGDGYSVYEMEAEAFAAVVREAAEADG